MDLDKLIEEYKENTIQLHLERDFIYKKKYINKINSIVKRVCALKKEKEFFEALFASNDPLILGDAAHDGFNCYYDLHKCLSILEYLHKNANNLVFCSDPVINKEIQDYYSSDTDIIVYEKEIEFYDYINNDYLYRKCYEYFNLIGDQMTWYHNQKNKKNRNRSSEIDILLCELKEKKYLNTLFDVANKKYSKSNYTLTFLAVNSYYACKYGYKKRKFRKILENILKIETTDLTPNLKNLVNKYLEAIDKNIEPDLRLV